MLLLHWITDREFPRKGPPERTESQPWIDRQRGWIGQDKFSWKVIGFETSSTRPYASHHWNEASLTSGKIPMYYTSQQDFVPRKFYCVSNVPFHAESKYVIKIFPSPTVFVQWHFLLLIFRNFSYFLQWFFFYMNKYFKFFWTQVGHIQFTIIKSLALCAQKQVVNETNVDSWR
jgi:hypothetical protein